jgi:hypothetical protein
MEQILTYCYKCDRFLEKAAEHFLLDCDDPVIEHFRLEDLGDLLLMRDKIQKYRDNNKGD